MNRLKNLVLVLCVAALALGVLQTQSHAGLLAEWLLDENPVANGVKAADTLGLNDMYYGDPDAPGTIYSTTGRFGVPNTAVHFDGLNDDARTPNLANTGILCNYHGNSMVPVSSTLEAFFKFESGASGNKAIYEENTGGGPTLQLNVNASDQLRHQIRIGSTWYVLDVLVTLSPDTWYYGAAVLDAVNLAQKLYLYDGTTMHTASRAWNGYGNNPRIYWNAIGSSANNFKGVIDNVRIYDEALDEATLLLHATIPEPSTLALVFAALSGLALYAWRKRS